MTGTKTPIMVSVNSRKIWQWKTNTSSAGYSNDLARSKFSHLKLNLFILSRKEGCMANNCGFKIWWLDLLDVCITVTVDYNSSHIKLLPKDICLRTLGLLSSLSNSGSPYYNLQYNSLLRLNYVSWPQTEHKLEWFVCCNLHIHCHRNPCLPNCRPTTVCSALPQECA
jgi:hypothetical protein